MTITSEEKYLLNNKMGRVANKVQLGTLIENAESIVAAEIALADGKVLIGNASGIATAVTLSGDVTTDRDGVTAIGSGVIVNADVSGSAAIAYSKLNLATSIVNADVSASAAIAYSKLNLATSILNADISASAAIAYSKLAALTSGNILVGSAGNVATSVAMSGDITISATGVTAIGAAKVTEAMLTTAGTAGLQAKRIAYAKFDPSATAGQRTQAAHDLGVTIPDNAFVLGAWYWVETTFTSAGDLATIALSLEGANDIVTAIAINDGSNPWDTTTKPVEGTTKLETTSTWLATTAARAVTATVATEDLTAGKMHVWLEYVVFS